MEPILEVENLVKIFSRSGQQPVTAVKNVSFEMLQGECLGIIGESGSGKTTLINMIARLIDVTEGQIFLEGQDITGLRGRELRKVYTKLQMVFQSPAASFDPKRTLIDGVGEGLRNAGMSKAEAQKQAEQLLETCGLTKEYRFRYPHEVSGGQCQRAAIARALTVKPKLLICDEATSALDMTIQKEIIELLNQLRLMQGDKLSILFICHDLALVQQFCDRVIVMHQGEIVEQGKTDEIICNPRHEYTRQLIDCAIALEHPTFKISNEGQDI